MSTRKWAKARPTVLMLVIAAAVLASLQGETGFAIQPAAASTGYPAADPAGGTGSFVLTATSSGSTYAPTFTGNGELGIRVPPTGQGYSGGSVPTLSELAGFYAAPAGGVPEVDRLTRPGHIGG